MGRRDQEHSHLVDDTSLFHHPSARPPFGLSSRPLSRARTHLHHSESSASPNHALNRRASRPIFILCYHLVGPATPHMPPLPNWALLVGLLPALSQVLAGQVPIHNGVIGGVPEASTRVLSTPGVLAATGNATPVQTTPGKLRVVENSGVCETTPGVYQASGYGDLSADQSLW